MLGDLKETFHNVPLDTLLGRLGADPEHGLTVGDASERLMMHGRNELTPPAQDPEWLKLFRHFTGFFSLLLEFGGVLCFIAYAMDSEADENMYLGLVLISVVVVTALFSYFQERKASDLLGEFSKMLPSMCVVVRDGQPRQIESTEVVPGDIIMINSGDKIPADARLLDTRGLKVDNSSLTGESDPQSRTNAPTHELVIESANVVFSGTMATDGKGKAVVVATGDNSFIGQIASLMSSTDQVETPIHREIAYFVRVITVIAITLGIVFGTVSLAMSRGFINSLVFMIGIIVANVPEGLLVTVTLSLTLTARRMSSKMVLVKSLESVETLGSTTLIASDKTGTLTQNRMTVVHAWFDGKLHECSATGRPNSHGFDLNSPTFAKLKDCAVVCNHATFSRGMSQSGVDNMSLPVLERDTIGDASESALIKFFEPILERDGGIEGHRALFPKVFEIPFNSTNKWHLRISEVSGDYGGGDEVLHIKGAPERIFEKCTTRLVDGKVVPITGEFRESFDAACLDIARMGERVFGFAFGPMESSGDAAGNNKNRKSKDAENDSGVHQVSGFRAANNLGNDDEEDKDLDGDDDDNYSSGSNGDGKFFDETKSKKKNSKKKKSTTYNDENVPKEGFCFIGLLSLLDPPRPSVPHAVSLCHTAGVSIIMVTGDHPVTAKAIAKQVGIIRGPTVDDLALERGVDVSEIDPREAEAVVIHGSAVRDLTDEDWDNILSKDQIVLARLSPEQKLTIVQECQRRGEIVAVTGDGVNDSPALKKADIGVAMGIMGSDVAKEAADLILLDDNFSSIVNGIEEGRLIFDNLKKSIAYTLSSNIPEITPFIVRVCLGLPLPLSTSLILCIDILCDMAPAIFLAYELPETDIMQRPPRNSKVDRLVTRALVSFSYLQIGAIQAFGALFTYFVVFADYGFAPSKLFGAASDWEDWLDDGVNAIDFEAAALCKIPHSTICGNRNEALLHAQTAGFLSIIVMQVADLLVCKTRRHSVFSQPFRNKMLICGIAMEVTLGLLLTYLPFLNSALGSRPIQFTHILPGLPFAFLILVYEEVRKLIVRQYQRRKENLALYQIPDTVLDGATEEEIEGKPIVYKDFKRWIATYTPW